MTLRKIGPYHLIHRIGEGGLAEVYLALKDGVAYAVKCLKPEKAAVQRYADDFAREVKIASTLRHPCVLGVMDSGKAGDTYFSVMEPVVGVALHQLVADGQRTKDRLPLPVSLFVLREALKALTYVHRTAVFEYSGSGTFHGDVSPANLLVSQDGRVLLTDFGSAGQATAADPKETHLGKMYYLPPEVLDRKPVTTGTDLYSLAVVAFYLLFGRRPFEAKDKLDLYRTIRSSDVPRLDCTGIVRDRKDDGPFRIFFNRALHKDPEMRFKTAQEFHDAFFAFHFAEPCPATRADFLAHLNRLNPNLFTTIAADWKSRIELHRAEEFRRPGGFTAPTQVESLLARINRRRHPRVAIEGRKVHADVLAMTEQVRVQAPVVELSQGGMLVQWEGLKPGVGRDYPLVLHLDQATAPIKATGRLLYEVHRQARPFVAFEFKDLAPQQTLALRTYVRSLLGPESFSARVAPKDEEKTAEDFVEVYFRTVGEFKVEYEKNLLHGGMFLQTQRPWIRDDEFLVRIQISNNVGRVVLKGKVVFCQPVESSVPGEERYGVAVQLAEPAEEIRRQLEECFDLKL